MNFAQSEYQIHIVYIPEVIFGLIRCILTSLYTQIRLQVYIYIYLLPESCIPELVIQSKISIFSFINFAQFQYYIHIVYIPEVIFWLIRCILTSLYTQIRLQVYIYIYLIPGSCIPKLVIQSKNVHHKHILFYEFCLV